MQLKLFKTKKVFKKGGIHINPEVYWIACLAVAFFVIVFFAVFGVYLFIKINKELSLATETKSVQIRTIDRERLDKILNYFSDKEKKSLEILNSSAPFVDPSL